MTPQKNTLELSIPPKLMDRCEGLVDGLNCSVEKLIFAILSDVTEDMETDEMLHTYFVSSALGNQNIIRERKTP